MTWKAAPSGRCGRRQTYSDAAIHAYLSMKVLFGMALTSERAHSTARSRLELTAKECPSVLSWRSPPKESAIFSAHGLYLLRGIDDDLADTKMRENCIMTAFDGLHELLQRHHNVCASQPKVI
jgi:hypothetical protein